MRVDKREVLCGYMAGVFLGVLTFVLIGIFSHVSVANSFRAKGRVDVASGQVTATLEPKPDGTTRWVFVEKE